jgi:hypothetical protein
MLEQLKALEKGGQWAEIMAMAPVIMSTLQGDDLATALLRLSKAHEASACTAAEYRAAVDYARRSAAAAVPGSFIHTWASARAATMLADIGKWTAARQHAEAFLGQVDQQPKAAVMAPWALAAVGRAEYYGRRPGRAVVRFRQALAACSDGALRERLQVWTAWALAATGRVTEAFAAIPVDVEHIDRGHLLAATARVCLAAGDWAGAQLNARLAQALMSINSVKGVEVGDGFDAAGTRGSKFHDVIERSPDGGWSRQTNRAGGIEGGMSNGEPVVVNSAAKPIPTLMHPLPSVDLASGMVVPAAQERSDVCVVPAAGVVGEAMVALVLADAFLEKFGGDTVAEIERNYRGYVNSLGGA